MHLVQLLPLAVIGNETWYAAETLLFYPSNRHTCTSHAHNLVAAWAAALASTNWAFEGAIHRHEFGFSSLFLHRHLVRMAGSTAKTHTASRILERSGEFVWIFSILEELELIPGLTAAALLEPPFACLADGHLGGRPDMSFEGRVGASLHLIAFRS
jgi:hypothetical protein